jgi:hypothetical protein
MGRNSGTVFRDRLYSSYYGGTGKRSSNWGSSFIFSDFGRGLWSQAPGPMIVMTALPRRGLRLRAWHAAHIPCGTVYIWFAFNNIRWPRPALLSQLCFACDRSGERCPARRHDCAAPRTMVAGTVVAKRIPATARPVRDALLPNARLQFQQRQSVCGLRMKHQLESVR